MSRLYTKLNLIQHSREQNWIQMQKKKKKINQSRLLDLAFNLETTNRRGMGENSELWYTNEWNES